MPVIIDNFEEQDDRAIKDTARILRIEARHEKPIEKHLGEVSVYAFAVYTALGILPTNYDLFETRLTPILRDLYDDVDNVFGKNLRKQIKNVPSEASSIVDQKINEKKSEFSLDRSKLIHDNTKKELQSIIDELERQSEEEALEELREEDPDAFYEALSLLAEGRNGTRAALISTVEVGTIESIIGDTEMSELAVLGLISLAKLRKIWNSIIDGRTRPAHRKAHRQKVPVNKPFIVGGEELRYPRDHRGSAKNIINCRCSYFLTMA
jgi:hypothetical protein